GYPDAHFVFTSDKSVLLNDAKTAFIMYGTQGKYWVALGDPVGDEEAFADLISDFINLAESHNCRAIFYQISDENLPLYLDAGYVLSKLGEEAVVSLSSFGLEGKSHRSLRSAHNRAERSGLTFSIVQPPHSAELLTQLKQISDEWLADKHVREKSFSLGRFDEAYLQHFPIALVEQEGSVIAFANVLQTDAHHGATVDLMRHSKDVPNGTMEFLFVELMLQLKNEGYGYFTLGLAPLSGLGEKHFKRTWDRFGLALYRFGGHFYNFDGLRKFKKKFRPEWHSRYLASAGGANPIFSLRAINALIAGSIKGAITK
ncbi:MAG: phosphatidylglycerol lysyltransferase domain-containing protein, partial [Hyphomicrobiales bacterium]